MTGEGSDCDCAEDWTCFDHRPFSDRMMFKTMKTSPVTHALHDCHCPSECTTVPPESCTKHPDHECDCTPMVPAKSLDLARENERRLIETLRAIVSMKRNPAALIKMVDYIVNSKEADACVAQRPANFEEESIAPILSLAALVDHYRDKLADVLAMDTPWPLRDVLTKFIESTDHLMNDHGCDAHGYELVCGARDHAKRIRAILGVLDP